ncbi:MAG: autotransporter domain-containing protein [Myxococcota bacterium]|nr:autotransporter domain-containing protein [Myxococcota bacterium]
MIPIYRTQQRPARRHATSLLWLIWLLTLALPTAADDFIVSTELDTGLGSLRQGVEDSNDVVANPDPPVNTLSFSGIAADTTFVLASPLENISNELTIDGTAPGGLILQGDGTTFVTIDADTKLRLTDLRFENGDLLLGNDANVTFEVTTGNTITIDDVIGDEMALDAGVVQKEGSGTLILTGTNTFTGEALIGGGVLQVTTDSLSSDANVTDGATLRFQQSTDGSYTGVISGSGAVEKADAGNLELTGSNTYIGGTTITAGTLSGAAGAIQGDVQIDSGASLHFTGTNAATYSGAISGSGTLIKSAGEILTLDPSDTANSWTQAQVLFGILGGDAAAISGNVDITSPGILLIDEDTTATYAGNLSGDGSFQKAGAGTLTLSGDNSGMTNTTPNAMRLIEGELIGTTNSIASNASILSGTTLSFDQSFDGTYNNAISGAGNLELRGNGVVSFAAAQTFTGTTLVSDGTLNVLNTFASDTTVASGATLGGTGNLAGSVTNSGRVAPGASIGTLSVDNIAFASGSTLEIEVDTMGGADQLAVTGNADLTLGTLDLQLAGGTYVSQVSTILTAGSLTGSLQFNDPFPLIDITLMTVGNSLQLTLNSNGASLATFATTPNQRAVASALDAETPGATGDMATVISSFGALTAPELAAALDSMSGETLTQFATARFEHADRFDHILYQRLRESSDSLDGVTRQHRQRGEGLLPDVSAGSSGARRLDLWFEPYFAAGDIDGHSGQSDVDYTLAGGAVGAEATPFADHVGGLGNLRLGAAFAYGDSDIDFSDRFGSGSAQSYMGALYGGWSNERYRAGLSGRVAYSDMESERSIRIGALVRNVEADFNGLDFGSRFEAGGKWIETEKYLLESYGSLEYAHLERSSITESGGGAVSLRIEREKLDTLRVGIGTRLRAIFQMGNDLWLLPELRAEWHQQLLDRDRTIAANFVSATVSPRFTIRGADVQSHSANIGIGWTVRSESGFEAAFDYDLGIDADRIANFVGVRVGTHW